MRGGPGRGAPAGKGVALLARLPLAAADPTCSRAPAGRSLAPGLSSRACRASGPVLPCRNSARARVFRQEHRAYAYIWKESALGLLEGPWSYEDKFLPVEAEYVANCQRFVAAGFSWEQGTFCDFDAAAGAAASPAPAAAGDRVAIRDVKAKSPVGSPGRGS